MQTRAFALHPVPPACPLPKLSSDQSRGDAARPQRRWAAGRAGGLSPRHPRRHPRVRDGARRTRWAQGYRPSLPPSGAHSHFQHNSVQDHAIHQLHVDAEVVLVPAAQGPEGFHLPGGRTGGLQATAEGPHSSPRATPPAAAPPPRSAHPGHQGALQELLQELGDGHVHVAGGRLAAASGCGSEAGSLGRQRRGAHSPPARYRPGAAYRGNNARLIAPPPLRRGGRRGAAHRRGPSSQQQQAGLPPPSSPRSRRRGCPGGREPHRERRAKGAAVCSELRRARERRREAPAQQDRTGQGSSAPAAALPAAGRALAPAMRPGPQPRPDRHGPPRMRGAERVGTGQWTAPLGGGGPRCRAGASSRWRRRRSRRGASRPRSPVAPPGRRRGCPASTVAGLLDGKCARGLGDGGGLCPPLRGRPQRGAALRWQEVEAAPLSPRLRPLPLSEAPVMRGLAVRLARDLGVCGIGSPPPPPVTRAGSRGALRPALLGSHAGAAR